LEVEQPWWCWWNMAIESERKNLVKTVQQMEDEAIKVGV